MKKINLSKFKIQTNTPFKRVGLILIGIYLLFLIGFAIIWNTQEKPFLYKTNDWSNEWSYGRYSGIPPKPNKSEGQGWVRVDAQGQHSWLETTHECDSRDPYEKRWEYYARMNPNSDFDISNAVVFEDLTIEEKRELAKEIMISEEKIQSEVCPIISELPDIDNYRWESSFEDFIEEVIEYWQMSVMFFIGLFFLFGVIDSFIKGIIKLYLWIKTGKWEKKAKEEKEKKRLHITLSSRSKKWICGSLVLMLWVTTEVIIKSSGIILGGIPYALMVLFWLWLFCKAIGKNIWKLENEKAND